MSNTVGGDGLNNRFNLSQIVALGVAYKRIFKACAGFPVLTIITPFVFKVVCFLSDLLTMNHSILSLIMTASSTIAIRRMIHLSAPSLKLAEESLVKIEVRLPCLMFLFSVTLIRVFILRIERRFGLAALFTWSPIITFSLAFRLAMGMFLLGIAVVSRYIGPASVVRCSSSPLLEHPVSTWVKSAMAHFHSAEAVAEFIAKPSESNSTPNPLTYAAKTRRLQRPTLRASLQQILLSVFIGTVVAYSSVLPLLSLWIPAGSPNTAALVASCIFATVMNLSTRLDGASHEINPYRYHVNQSLNRLILARMSARLQSLLISSVAVPVLAIISSSLVVQDISRSMTWSATAASFIAALLVTLYLHLFDEALRVVLCSPPLHMKEIVDDIANDDRMETFLEVTITSILHSDLSLVEKLCSMGKPRLLDLDREERSLNEESIKSMANILLQKTAADENGAHLEEDILRLSILASLGGSGRGSSGLDKADAHHVENIKQWVQPKDTMKVGGSRSEILSVPLVRALCAYAGGLGEALLLCSSQKPMLSSFPWSLPPGAIVQSEYAIRAATRCIFWNISNSVRCQTDWRSSHLSMLVPVLMNSACRLESGLIQYAEMKRSGKHNTNVRSGGKQFSNAIVAEPQLTPDQKLLLIKTECPELLSLYQECNDSATMILEKLRLLEGARNFDLPLDGITRRWTDSLITRMPNQTPNRSF